MRFADLARHVVFFVVPIESEKNTRFIDGLNHGLYYSLAREAKMDSRFNQWLRLLDVWSRFLGLSVRSERPRNLMVRVVLVVPHIEASHITLEVIL